jgi:hypothetical protein
MLGADDEVGVEGAGRRLVGPHASQLVQEPGRQVQRRIRVNRLAPVTKPGESGQSRWSKSSDGTRLLNCGRPGGALHGAPDRDSSAQRIHSRGARREEPELVHHLLRQWGAGQIRFGRPFPGPQQLGDLGVAAALDELADRVPAVMEPSPLAVDPCQKRFSCHHVLQSG